MMKLQTVCSLATITALCLWWRIGDAATPAAGAVLLGFSSATQDIAIDACRIEMAPGDAAMQSAMSATYTVGYRIGMICSGAGSLKLASYLGSTKEHYLYGAWQQSYWLMAALSLVGIATPTVMPLSPSTPCADDPSGPRT